MLILSLVLLLLLVLAGCESNQIQETTDETVPESIVDRDAAEIRNNTQARGIYLSEGRGDEIIYSVSHNPDSETHTDTVGLTFTVYYPYGEAHFYLENIYQYYKDSDTWSLIEEGNAGKPITEWYDSIIDHPFGNTDTYGSHHECTTLIRVLDIDTDAEIITLDYDISTSDGFSDSGQSSFNYGTVNGDAYEWYSIPVYAGEGSFSESMYCNIRITISGVKVDYSHYTDAQLWQ